MGAADCRKMRLGRLAGAVGCRGCSSVADMFGLQGKLVIVTGGSLGIGRAICAEFAALGAMVVCADIIPPHDLDQQQADGSVKYVQADFSTPGETCPAVVAAALEWQPESPVSVLVNNVGIQEDNGTPAHLLDEAVFDRVMNINLKSYFLMAKHCLPSMLQAERGVILNTASVQGSQSQVGIPAYASSKGAVLSFTRQLAMDYSSRGVRAVSVSPGSIRTPLVERMVKQDGLTCEQLGATYPLGRMGAPEDVAQLVSFLASERASNITGCDVLCDGGIMAMGSWDKRVGYTSHQ